jgi:fatty acid synthase
MGMVAGGVLSTFIPAHADFSWPVPPDWSLEDAATVPATYSIVIYALLLVSTRLLCFGTSTYRSFRSGV